MRILLTGATGRLGRELGKKLVFEGHEIVALVRDPAKARLTLPYPAKLIKWNAQESVPPKALEDVEAVFHLAGEPVHIGRWSQDRKQELRDSRILGAKKLVSAIEARERDKSSKVRHFITASAVGFYGDTAETCVHENHKPSRDFMGELCQAWEREADALKRYGIRVAQLRIGLVLEAEGGALASMIPLFSRGLGAKLGDGQQWMSWIHIKDVTEVLEFTLRNPELQGPINAVSPQPARNAEFSDLLAKSLGQTLHLKAPDVATRSLYGEVSDVVLHSSRVSADKLLEAGFEFNYPDLKSALEQICAPLRSSSYLFISEQWVPGPPEKLFAYFTDWKSLEVLMPKFLHFKVLEKSTNANEVGISVSYHFSFYGFPFKWQARVESWQPPLRFTLAQEKGPFKAWQHTHDFIPMGEGTLVRDQIRYELPLGILGRFIVGAKFRADLQRVFDYRREILAQRFGTEIRKPVEQTDSLRSLV